MLILAFETSCDDTAVAIVENGRKVVANIVFSQIELHNKTGGVVPEIAAREHAINLVPALKKTLESANLSINQIDAFASTVSPGLLSSLITGFTAAQTLSILYQKPFIPVHHIAGHIYANFLDNNDEINFPIVSLTVSGGHNDLYLLDKHLSFTKLGSTLDDAAGEAFDKISVLLGLGYPGGPKITKLASLYDYSKPFNIKLPKPMLNTPDFNFSFSGLKTAVLNQVKIEHLKSGKLTEKFKIELCAAFQESIAQVLITKLVRAAKLHFAKEIHLAGGVSANSRIRQLLGETIIQNFQSIQLRYPQNLRYCTDNAAMIAGVAWFHYQKNAQQFLPLSAIIPTPKDRIF